MGRWLLLLLCMLGLAPAVRAQDTLQPPTEAITLRSFDAQRIAAYQADPEFQYDRDLVRVPTLWERFKEWISEWFDSLFGSRAGEFVMSNLLYILIGAILIIAVVSSAGKRGAFQAVLLLVLFDGILHG